MLVRRLARPMLSTIFVVAGFNTLRNPDGPAPAAAAFVDKAKTVVPQPLDALLPKNGAAAVRFNGAVHVVAGLLLATGRVPRLASLALAATLVPTTFVGHAFWTKEDPVVRRQQQLQFAKNVSIMGGLLLAATDGAPHAARLD